MLEVVIADKPHSSFGRIAYHKRRASRVQATYSLVFDCLLDDGYRTLSLLPRQIAPSFSMNKYILFRQIETVSSRIPLDRSRNCFTGVFQANSCAAIRATYASRAPAEAPAILEYVLAMPMRFRRTHSECTGFSLGNTMVTVEEEYAKGGCTSSDVSAVRV